MGQGAPRVRGHTGQNLEFCAESLIKKDRPDRFRLPIIAGRQDASRIQCDAGVLRKISLEIRVQHRKVILNTTLKLGRGGVLNRRGGRFRRM